MSSKRKRGWKQGVFSPNNPSKYTGTFPIVYRSGLELSVMRFFDENSRVVQWKSESIIIRYISPLDSKPHRYFTDFMVEIIDNSGIHRKYIIEVKPYKQTIPPTTGGNKKPRTILTEQLNWAVNSAKWKSAEEWCAKNGYTFSKLTEKDIKQYL
jgi:hypothetical protein